MAVALRFGRNLTSLEYTLDVTDRATRICPLCARIGGLPTYLGNARWKVTGNASGTLTLADPAGGAPPVKFDDQFNNATGETWYLYRESTAKAYAITDSMASPSTVTITGDPGIAVGEYVQFRTSAAALDPIAQGPAGDLSTLSRGYVLPLLATGKASNVLTLAKAGVLTADDQYVGDDAAFSNFVQTSVGDFSTLGSNTWPTFTVVLDTGSGADTSGLAVGDWCVSGDISAWRGLGGQSPSLPPMTVTSIIDASTLVVEIRGKGPTFVQGLSVVPLQFFRPVAANLTGTVTDSDATAATVTVDDATSLTATTSAPLAIELSYTPMVGEIPYYLDHPVYIDPANVGGLGAKFGTIDRGDVLALANLSPNAWARNWTGGAPDGYTASAGVTMTEVTDPLYTELGGHSILVTPIANAQWQFRTPVFPWRAPAPGQRFSVRAHLMFPERWSGNLAVSMRLGFVTASGQIVTWNQPDPVQYMVPPDSTSTAASSRDVSKPASGSWFDAPISGFDITTARDLTVQRIGPQNAVGFFVVFVGETAGVPPFIFDGIAITKSHVPVDDLATFGEFGQANFAWQETNKALSLIAKPLPTIAVDVLDLQRANPDTADVIDTLEKSGDILAHAPTLGLMNETAHITQINRDHKRPKKTRIIVGNPLARYTSFFVKRLQQVTSAASSATAALGSQGGSSSGSGSGSTTGGSSGSTQPTVALSITVAADGSTVITAVPSANVTHVKVAYSTSAPPTVTDVRGGTDLTTGPFTMAGPTLTSGQTVYASAFAYTAQEEESLLANQTATKESVAVGILNAGFFITRTIDATKLAGEDRTDDLVFILDETFPEMKSVSNGGHVIDSAGADIHVVNGDASAEETFTLIAYDPTTGHVVLAIKPAGTTSHTTNRDYLVAYGDPAITSSLSDSAATFPATLFDFAHGFDDNGAGGIKLTDRSANGINATNHSATLDTTSGLIAGGAAFNPGSSQYVQLPHNATFDAGASNPKTILVLFMTGSSFPAFMALFEQQNGSGGWQGLAARTDGKPHAYLNYNLSGVDLIGSTVMSTNTKYVGALRIADGTNGAKLYLNGSLEAQANLGFFAGLTADFNIGGNPFNSSRYFNGKVGEIWQSPGDRSAGWVGAYSVALYDPSTFSTGTTETAI